MYSLSTLKIVKQHVPLPILRAATMSVLGIRCVQGTFFPKLLLVTFVVTLGRRASGRVALCQNRQGKQVEKQVG